MLRCIYEGVKFLIGVAYSTLKFDGLQNMIYTLYENILNEARLYRNAKMYLYSGVVK